MVRFWLVDRLASSGNVVTPPSQRLFRKWFLTRIFVTDILSRMLDHALVRSPYKGLKEIRETQESDCLHFRFANNIPKVPTDDGA